MTDEGLLKPDAVARLLSFSIRQIQDMAAKGEIPAAKIGGAWRFDRTAIEKWVQANTTGPQSAES